jgi:cell division protease FtsH
MSQKQSSKPKQVKDNNSNSKKKKQARTPWSQVVSVFLVFFILIYAYSLISGTSKKTQEISLSQLAKDIESGLVTEVTVSGNNLQATYSASPDEKRISTKEPDASLSDSLINLGVTESKMNAISISVEKESGLFYWIGGLAPIFVPILIIVLLIWFMTRQVRGAGMQAFTFGQSKARMILPDDTKEKVTFKDVAGVKEAKQELAEIVDFLKNPKKFLDIGARIPKGILLMGAAGTGKTMLARAVAGEANVAFFSVSGSEFVEMFVGVGSSRVRDLFALAKKMAPAIIFIDEIDAVGRVRGVGTGGGNDEREQTLNQILVEMDGFDPTEKVVVMAATNRPDVLDPALLRPGRFDRRVTLDYPDRNDRLEILKVHSRSKPFAEDVNLNLIAERTPGFSGADLSSLMNEGAILAAREERNKISQYDLIRSIEKVMLGPERKSHVLSKKEKELTAYHEAGHALLASLLPYADPVHKISIISRGRAAGYTLKLPIEDKKLQSKNEFLDDITVSLGGYVVEKNIFGDLTTGSSNDLQVATALARDMVTKYGMSEKVGPIALEGNGGRALFGRGVEDGAYSDRVNSMIDEEVEKIMKGAMDKAYSLITEKRVLLDIIAKRLVEVESIEQTEYEQILVAHGVTLKKKMDIENAG